jgi:hypothetical protein
MLVTIPCRGTSAQATLELPCVVPGRTKRRAEASEPTLAPRARWQGDVAGKHERDIDAVHCSSLRLQWELTARPTRS